MNAGGKRAVRGWRVLSNGHASAQLECHTCPHQGIFLKKRGDSECWRCSGGGGVERSRRMGCRGGGRRADEKEEKEEEEGEEGLGRLCVVNVAELG